MGYQELINSNIKKLRLTNNFTQEEFAEKIGLSIQGLSNIERNRYQPTSDTVDKICSAFNITAVELLLSDLNSNDDVINNINVLLKQCSRKKLENIYKIISLLINNITKIITPYSHTFYLYFCYICKDM